LIFNARHPNSSFDGRRAGGWKTCSASFAPAVLWLLLASSFVTAVSPRLTPASGLQAGGQFASTVIGQANFTSVSDGFAPNILNHPFRTTFDSSGNLWVADENNHRVVEFKPPFTDGEAASLEIGQPNFTTSITNATQSTLSGPVSLVFDKSGDLWVSDFVDSRVTEYKPPFTSGMNASLELGQPAGDVQFVTHGARTPGAGLADPLDLAFDSAGDLWVDDRSNNRVVEYATPFVDGGSPSVVIGQESLDANLSSTTQNGLNGPESIAFDSSNNLWVVDQLNNRVLEFTASSLKGDGAQASLEIGQPAGQNEFSTSAPGTSQGSFNAPVGIAFDPSGDLLVSDRANNRILGFTPPLVDGMNASFEIGQPTGPDQFAPAPASVSQSSLSNPLGITFDARGDLWVADELNGRVLEFSGTAIATAGVDVAVSRGGASADETSTTGVRMGVKGVASGSFANFYSAALGSQPPATGSLGLSSPMSFYEAKVSGLTGGMASLCVASPKISGSTYMSLYVAATWSAAAGLNRTVGASICASMPTSSLNSVLLIAIGGGSPGSTSLSTVEIVAITSIGIVLVGAAYLAISRRRGRHS
jgi:sugar lactone lactonase YvrE